MTADPYDAIVLARLADDGGPACDPDADEPQYGYPPAERAEVPSATAYRMAIQEAARALAMNSSPTVLS